MKSFSVCPGASNPARLAVFIGERNGSPASIRLFNLPNLTSPIAMKSFFKADQISFHWHPTGSHLLLLAQTDIDKTGKSYYGESHLVFLSCDGKFDCLVRLGRRFLCALNFVNYFLDKEGPIYDMAWRPGAQEFVVLYGFMPAKATLFNGRCEPIFVFDNGPKNTARFNQQGNLLVLAGYGNLAGQTDIYCIASQSKNITTPLPIRGAAQNCATVVKHLVGFQAANTTTISWSHTGRHLLLATLSPRLRVDNGIQLWHYHGGAPVYRLALKELNQSEWLVRPESPPVFDIVSPLYGPVSATASMPPEKRAYVPPSKRGLPIAPCPVGLETPNAPYVKKSYCVPTPKSVFDRTCTAAATSTPPAKTAVSPAAAEVSTKPVLSQKEKLIKNISQKLDQIKILKEKQAQGVSLELNQLDKMNKEVDLLKQLNMLALEK
jgi:translation initiation factor 2A